MATASEPPAGIAFGRFVLLPHRRELLADGRPIKLGGRAFDVLMALVEARGAVVSKDALMARVWPDRIVEENNLQWQISALRAAFGADRSLIRTLSGRGYQFAAEIDTGYGSQAADAGTAIAAAPPALREARSDLGIRGGLPPTNLPEPISELIGRDEVLGEILSLASAHRLVTLTGAGGIGKTRLALAAARRLLPQFADGAWLAEFSPITDPGFVPVTVAAAIGLGLGGGEVSAQRVAQALAGRRLLLVLDTCEHVIGAAAEMAETVLRAGGKLHLLATSREPLRAEGEWVYPVPPLAVPAEEAEDAGDLSRYGAVRLFVERLRAAEPHFAPDRRSAEMIAAICRRLDGIPLAIELAAARAALLGVEEVATHLDDRFRILTGGRRTAVPRHQALRATLDWSYERLGEPERILLRQLAVFAGTFSLEAAAAVVREPELPPAAVIDGMVSLVAKSLVAASVGGAHPQYHLLDTMREYARQKAADAGELAQTRRRHAEYMARLFAQADAEAEQRGPVDWRAAYSRYLDDVRAALDWAMQPEGDAELGISLTADAVTLWSQLSLFRELQQRTEQALERLGDAAAQGGAREIKLFAGLSTAEVDIYEATPKGTAASRAALEIARRIGNDSYQLKALLALWNGCFATGEVGYSLELAEEFMEVAARLGRADVLVGHRLLGSSNFYLGDVVIARQHMETMVAGYRATTHDAHMARFSFGQLASGLGLLAFYLGFQGHVDQAMKTMRQSVDEALQSNHAMTVCGVLGTTSIQLSIYMGYLDEARRYVEILYDRARRYGLLRRESFARGYDGILCIREGQLEEGLRKLSGSFAPCEDRSNTRYMLIFCEHALATGLAGTPSGALRAIGEIHDRLVATGVRWYLPEVHRCRARLLEMSGGEPADVEATYRQSLSLAEAMGALT